jgi:hypothetical protein
MTHQIPAQPIRGGANLSRNPNASHPTALKNTATESGDAVHNSPKPRYLFGSAHRKPIQARAHFLTPIPATACYTLPTNAAKKNRKSREHPRRKALNIPPSLQQKVADRE